jgi:hypothetical protein
MLSILPANFAHTNPQLNSATEACRVQHFCPYVQETHKHCTHRSFARLSSSNSHSSRTSNAGGEGAKEAAAALQQRQQQQFKAKQQHQAQLSQRERQLSQVPQGSQKASDMKSSVADTQRHDVLQHSMVLEQQQQQQQRFWSANTMTRSASARPSQK